MPTKIDLAVIAILLAGGLVVIETGHRIDLASPAVGGAGA